jgi:hypothetical protein
MEMIKVIACVLCIAGTVSCGRRTITDRTGIRYEYFDDFLISVAAPRAHNAVLKPDDPQSTPSPVEAEVEETFPVESPTDADRSRMVDDPDITGYFRDIPREDWSCCMLGKLAGDKGFHCHVDFYSARIARRNNNRAHNTKMLFHGPDRIPNWGRDIMTTFERCIYGQPVDFNRCCHAAVVEKRERVKWRQYRQQAAARR